MSKQKYYRTTNILKKDAEYNILLGEKSNGKSYAVKEFVLNQAWKTGAEFIYLRRWETEIKPVAKVEKYFDDSDILTITNGECNCMSAFKGVIYFALNDGEKINRVKRAGEYMYLSGATHYSSLPYPNVHDILFEEIVPMDGIYLNNEVNTLMVLISTIARRRRLRVWMIGNVISRMCPYFSEWQLKGIPKQKQGTIEVYNINTDQLDDKGNKITIKVAVEFCENSGKNGRMFFGSASQMINNGAWQCDPQPHLPDKYRQYNVIYGVSVKYKDLYYNMELLQHKDSKYVIVYVYPASNHEKYKRKISDIFAGNLMTTEKLSIITQGDKVIRDYISLKKICYSDNLTGTEFEDIIEKIW